MERAPNLYRRSPETASQPARPQVFRLVDVEGRVLPAGGYEQFADDPIGWDSINIHLKRGKEHGVNYEFTDGEVALEFDAATGKELIERVYARAGSDGIIGFQYGYLVPPTAAPAAKDHYLRQLRDTLTQGAYTKIGISMTLDEYNFLAASPDFQSGTLGVELQNNSVNDGNYAYQQITYDKYARRAYLWIATADLAAPNALGGAYVKITLPRGGPSAQAGQPVLISQGGEVEYEHYVDIVGYYRTGQRIYWDIDEPLLELLRHDHYDYFRQFQIIDSINNSGSYQRRALSSFGGKESYVDPERLVADPSETSGRIYIRYLAPASPTPPASAAAGDPVVGDPAAGEPAAGEPSNPQSPTPTAHFVPYFDGKLNLNEAEFADYAVLCPVERSDFEDRLRTRYRTKVNFNDATNLDGGPVEEPPAYPVLLPVKPEYQRAEFRQAPGIFLGAGQQDDRSELEFFAVPSFPQTVETAEDAGGSPRDIAGVYNPSGPSGEPLLYTSPPIGTASGEDFIAHPEAVFLQNEFDGLYTFDISVQGAFDIQRRNALTEKYQSLEWVFYAMIVTVAPPDAVEPGKVTYQIIKIGDQQSFGYGKNVRRAAQFAGKFTLYLTSHQEVYFFHHWLAIRPSGRYDINFIQNPTDTNYLKITSEVAVPGSAARGYLIHDVVQHLIRSAAGPSIPLQSNFFGLRLHGYAADGTGGRNLLLMGEDVRNREGATFVATYQQVYDSLDALFCIGQAIEYDSVGDPVVRVENIEYFYRDAEILRINVCSNYREKVATDLIYNSVEVGYKKYLEEKTDTLDSVHTKQEYLTPIRSYQKNFKIISDFIADPYALEHTRREQFSKEEKESWRYDDDLFILAVQNGLRETYYVRKIGEVGTRPSGETFALLTLNVDGKAVRPRLAASPDLLMSVVAADGTEQVRGIEQLTYSLDEGNYLIVVPAGPALTLQEATQVVFSSALGGFSTERSEPFSRIDGIENPDTYVNLRHTPQRMLHRWGVWLNSMLSYKDASEQYQNTYTKNNRQVVTKLSQEDYESRAQLNGDAVHDGGSVSLSGVNNFNRLFTPEYIEFDAPISWQQIQLLREAHQGRADQANYGYISVVDFNGDLKQGYLQELVYNPVEEQSRFKLLKKSDQPQCNLSVQVIDEGIAYRFSLSGTRPIRRIPGGTGRRNGGDRLV